MGVTVRLLLPNGVCARPPSAARWVSLFRLPDWALGLVWAAAAHRTTRRVLPREARRSRVETKGLRTPAKEPMAGPRQGPVAAPRQGPVAAPRQGPVAAPRQGPVAAPRQGPVAAPRQGPVAAPMPAAARTLHQRRGTAVRRRFSARDRACAAGAGSSTVSSSLKSPLRPRATS
jgi:hypothetical protein